MMKSLVEKVFKNHAHRTISFILRLLHSDHQKWFSLDSTSAAIIEVTYFRPVQSFPWPSWKSPNLQGGI